MVFEVVVVTGTTGVLRLRVQRAGSADHLSTRYSARVPDLAGVRILAGDCLLPSADG